MLNVVLYGPPYMPSTRHYQTKSHSTFLSRLVVRLQTASQSTVGVDLTTVFALWTVCTITKPAITTTSTCYFKLSLNMHRFAYKNQTAQFKRTRGFHRCQNVSRPEGVLWNIGFGWMRLKLYLQFLHLSTPWFKQRRMGYYRE